MKFSIIGPSGYIGHRHLEAIQNLEGSLLSYLDIKECNSIDKNVPYYSKEEEFFSSFKVVKPNFCVICSPNYMHARQIIECIDSGISVICEKPLCIKNEELNHIEKKLKNSDAKLFSIMQLRLHPVLKEIKRISNSSDKNKEAKISVITPRDKDYLDSWKTKKKYSGGILFNLGIHYFDLLIQVFGNPSKSELIYNEELKAKGATYFKDLKVEWYFSIDPEDQTNHKDAQRIFNINGEDIVFSSVPNDLHYENYSKIISGDSNFDFYSILPTMEYILNLNER